MGQTATKINTTPVNTSGVREMGVDLKSKAKSRRPGEYKYTHQFGKSLTDADHFLDLKQDAVFWDPPNNFEATLNFHAPKGYVITHVDVKYDISSDMEAVRIVKGGINESFIELAITGQYAYWFIYQVNFYGRKTTQAMEMEEVVPKK